MLDLKFVRENADLVQKSSADKGIEINISHILEIDSKYQELSSAVQKLREERNKFAKERNIEEGKKLKDKLEKEEKAAGAVEEELINYLSKIPNIAASDVKAGKSDQENEVVRKEGEPMKFDFTPKDHLALGEELDIIDIERAAKVSGTRFSYLKNDAVLLEFVLVQFAFDILTKERFAPVVPPVLIKKETMQGLGYMENG
ncbi:MAG: serine--tRNA ligase, partial [Candidatus Levyibacteriota bacterium]